MEDCDRSPVPIPSFVSKNLSPEKPLNDGFDVTEPNALIPILG